MAKYTVLSPIRTGGATRAPGTTIELDDETAQYFLTFDYPTIQAIQAVQSPNETPAKKPSKTPEPAPEPGKDGADHVEMPSPGTPEIISPQPPSQTPKVNVNTASVDELTTAFKAVNGIGKGSAQAVYDNRPYESLEAVPDQADLVGIARASWPQVMPYLTV